MSEIQVYCNSLSEKWVFVIGMAFYVQLPCGQGWEGYSQRVICYSPTLPVAILDKSQIHIQEDLFVVLHLGPSFIYQRMLPSATQTVWPGYVMTSLLLKFLWIQMLAANPSNVSICK